MGRTIPLPPLRACWACASVKHCIITRFLYYSVAHFKKQEHGTKCASAKFLGLGPTDCQDSLVSKVTDQELATGIRFQNRPWVFPVSPTGNGHNILESKISWGVKLTNQRTVQLCACLAGIRQVSPCLSLRGLGS
jgi:hypothetical protein